MIESNDQIEDEGDDGLTMVVIQYPVEGWGTAEDLIKRHRAEDLLDAVLKSSETGYCDGGDIGSGSMEVFCYVIDPASTSRLVIESLAANALLTNARVEYEQDEEWVVVWPKHY